MNVLFSGNDEKQLLSGSHRTCSVQETLARILPIKHKFGISRVANVTGLDHIGLHVVIAVRPNARSIAISQGKGRTLDHAKASAVMEAIEIWHAEHFDKPVFFASAADLLARHKFVDLDQLPSTRGRIPTHTERLHWVKAVELNSEQEMLVPLEMVHADYTHPLPPGVGCFPSSTNGLAAGNHILEAICHGICEVIERDALSVWHHASFKSQQATRLALGSIDDTFVIGVLQDFWNAGLECCVWDVTSDLGVATFLCIVREPGAESDHLGLGSGTHPDRAVALQRALNEAAQTRLNYITGAREDLTIEEYSMFGRRQKSEAFSELFVDGPKNHQFDQAPTRVNDNLKADLNWLQINLRRAGIEQVAVVDLTREEFKIPVVRVIIPGLEAPHDDDTYVPGARAERAANGKHVG